MLKHVGKGATLMVVALAALLGVGVLLSQRPALAQLGGESGTPSEHGAATPSPEHVQGAQAEETGRKHEVIEFDVANAIWVLIIFIVLLVVLYPTAWKGVLAGLKAREERIRREITDAENKRAQAETTLKEYTTRLATAEAQVKDMIARAAAEGEKIAGQIRTRSQQEAEEIKEKANRDIEAAKNQAITEVYERTAELATSVAERILRRNLNADDQRDLVKRSLEQLETMNQG